MKKIALLVALIVVAGLVVGCATRPPVLIDLRTGPTEHETADVTTNAVGSKTGEATSMQILALFGSGDDSIAAAAAAGGITKIATVDQRAFQIGWIYGTYTTIVTGE
jgi:hypothetical protein